MGPSPTDGIRVWPSQGGHLIQRVACDECLGYRKEFFRLPLDRLRAAVANRAVDVSFTMVAEAREYRESLALSRMSPEEREKYLEHQEMAFGLE